MFGRTSQAAETIEPPAALTQTLEIKRRLDRRAGVQPAEHVVGMYALVALRSASGDVLTSCAWPQKRTHRRQPLHEWADRTSLDLLQGNTDPEPKFYTDFVPPNHDRDGIFYHAEQPAEVLPILGKIATLVTSNSLGRLRAGVLTHDLDPKATEVDMVIYGVMPGSQKLLLRRLVNGGIDAYQAARQEGIGIDHSLAYGMDAVDEAWNVPGMDFGRQRISESGLLPAVRTPQAASPTTGQQFVVRTLSA